MILIFLECAAVLIAMITISFQFIKAARTDPARALRQNN